MKETTGQWKEIFDMLEENQLIRKFGLLEVSFENEDDIKVEKMRVFISTRTQP